MGADCDFCVHGGKTYSASLRRGKKSRKESSSKQEGNLHPACPKGDRGVRKARKKRSTISEPEESHLPLCLKKRNGKGRPHLCSGQRVHRRITLKESRGREGEIQKAAGPQAFVKGTTGGILSE